MTVNAIRAGVTLTPALMQIPEKDLLIAHGMKPTRNGRHDDRRGRRPGDRDAVAATGTHWITGNVLGIDGGELISG